MRGPLLLLLLIFGGIGGAQAARTPFQIRCEDEISKTVSVLTTQENGYRLDTHLSYKALTTMKGPAGPNSYVLGLTQTESRVLVSLDGPMLEDAASGYECVAPRITVKLYYVPVVIYVGSEFAPGSCAYDQVLAHELRHMQTYMAHLPKVEKLVRAALAKRFGNAPLYAPRGTARAALASEINTGWLPYIKAEMAKVEAQQAAIDSAQEYARLSNACQGQIQTILRHGRGR
ncbi:MAG: hypothetical protein V4754_17660 [Pseudomonadota bacterium]